MPITGDISVYEAALAWRAAAEADGWVSEKMYPNEPYMTASQHKKEGFQAHVIIRKRDLANCNPKTRDMKYDVDVAVWGPDGLAVKAKKVYNWEEMKKALRRCGYCHAEDVETSRVGFAGRCCAACVPTVRPRVEYKGWCD